MQSQYIYQDTNIPLKIGFKNIRRSSPTRDQNWPLETQVEETNRDTNLAEGFTVLTTTTLNKLNSINMPSSTKDYIVRKATSLQNRANDIRQQQLQQQTITETIFLENSRTKRGDVSDLQELEAVLEHMEMLQTMSDSLREQQFQAILELGVELQDILQEIQKLHNAYPLPEGDLLKSVANTPDCILDTPRKHDGPALQNTRIPQNPHKIRKKKKKQILPLCPTQTLEPEKADQTQRLQNAYSLPEGDLATPVQSAANPMTGRKKIKAKYYQKPSPPQLDPQSRNAPSPAPQPQLAQTDKAWHPPSETPTPRRGVDDFIRSADGSDSPPHHH
jgi:hypothetical protein